MRATGKRFVASGSGRFIAYNDGALWVARAADVPNFRKIADPSKPIYSIMWAPDGSRLFYTVGPVDENEKDPKEQFHSIRFDGSEDRQFATFDSTAATNYSVRDLLGYDPSKDEVIWNIGNHDGAGGAQELHATSVTSGSSRPFNVSKEGIAYHAFALTADATGYFYVKDKKKLVRFSLVDGTERTVYSAAATEAAIELVMASADGSSVFFQGTAAPHQFADASTKGITSTYRLDTATGDIDLVLSENGADDVLRLASVAPDGRHLWLSSYTVGGADVLLAVEDGAKTQIAPDTEAGAEQIRHMTWLTLEVR